MAVLHITGAATVLSNMGQATKRMGILVGPALAEAGLMLQRESVRLAPVEFGNLRASAYTASRGRDFRTVVEVGYTASYALFVHEKVAMKLRGQPRRPSPPHIGRYWDPQGQAQAKFLEQPARRLGPRMLALIKLRLGLP